MGRNRRHTSLGKRTSQITKSLPAPSASIEWLKVLEEKGIQISMDGRGRCCDDIFVERLWRIVKQEEVYLKEYLDVRKAEMSLRKYFDFYNYLRPHQSLGNKTPFEIYQKGLKIIENKGTKAANF